jgi:hypothetical protein
MKWTGQDVGVYALCDVHNCIMTKRRSTYMFCGFTDSSSKNAFKVALSDMGGVSFQDWMYPHDSGLLVVKVEPI